MRPDRSRCDDDHHRHLATDHVRLRLRQLLLNRKAKPEEFRQRFVDAMDDDLNTSGALGAVFVLIGECPDLQRFA